MPVPAAVHLLEFTPTPRAGAAPPLRALEAPPATDPLEDAFQRGREAGLQAAREENEARLAEAREAADAELAEARRAWAEEEGGRLGELIAEAFGTLESNIGDAVAASLTPFLAEAVRGKAVDDLVETMAQLIGKGRLTLHVEGPDDLLEAIRRKLGPAASAIEFERTDTVDARVRAEETVIETEIGAWLKRISAQDT